MISGLQKENLMKMLKERFRSVHGTYLWCIKAPGEEHWLAVYLGKGDGEAGVVGRIAKYINSVSLRYQMLLAGLGPQPFKPLTKPTAP